jgi:hypothetical protein
VRPNSRRLSRAGASTLGGAGAQVLHPVELQLPHELAVLLMTLRDFSIAFLLSDFKIKNSKLKITIRKNRIKKISNGLETTNG